MAEPARPVVFVMGVTGTGKTTIGKLLAEELKVPHADADEFHPPKNIAKMSAGIPLDDDDRAPWLDAIGAWARERGGRGGVVSCSALKRSYRDRLRAAEPRLFFLHLTGDKEVIARRLERRKDHFMPAALLDSQLATLEPLAEDEDGMAVDVTSDAHTIVRQAAAVLRRRWYKPMESTD